MFRSSRERLTAAICGSPIHVRRAWPQTISFGGSWRARTISVKAPVPQRISHCRHVSQGAQSRRTPTKRSGSVPSTAGTRPVSATVVSCAAEDRLLDLFAQLPALTLVEHSEQPLIVILVSVNFAAQLDRRGSAIAGALPYLLRDAPVELDVVHVLVAVVDKIPRPADTTAKHERSVDGICVASTALYCLDEGLSVGNNWTVGASRFTHSLEPDKPSSLTLGFPAHDVATPQIGVHAHFVQLPLPSTIFQNGKHYTLFEGQFKRDQDSTSWQQNGVKDIQHAEVTLPMLYPTGASAAASVQLPLVQMTNTQEVVSCMGNIVRELGPPSGKEDDAQPASSMLEKAVADYFKTTGIAPHAMSVWALLVPRKAVAHIPDEVFKSKKLPEQWKSAQSVLLGSNSIVPLRDLFAAGARLHRVTSGGGGWGNKAGLISLHPEISYTPPPNPELADMSESYRMQLDDNFGMPSTAEPGDLLQFHFLPTDVDLYQAVQNRGMHATASQVGSTFEFGVIPSSLDDMVSESDIDSSSSTGAGPILYTNRFGALSEKGMALTIHGLHEGSGGVEPWDSQSKIDVPFARFTVSYPGWQEGAQKGGSSGKKTASGRLHLHPTNKVELNIIKEPGTPHRQSVDSISKPEVSKQPADRLLIRKVACSLDSKVELERARMASLANRDDAVTRSRLQSLLRFIPLRSDMELNKEKKPLPNVLLRKHVALDNAFGAVRKSQYGRPFRVKRLRTQPGTAAYRRLQRARIAYFIDRRRSRDMARRGRQQQSSVAPILIRTVGVGRALRSLTRYCWTDQDDPGLLRTLALHDQDNDKKQVPTRKAAPKELQGQHRSGPHPRLLQALTLHAQENHKKQLLTMEEARTSKEAASELHFDQLRGLLLEGAHSHTWASRRSRAASGARQHGDGSGGEDEEHDSRPATRGRRRTRLTDLITGFVKDQARRRGAGAKTDIAPL